MSLAIVYGSSMGNTKEAAELIKEKLELKVDILDVADCDAEKLNEFDKLICGTSTWNDGELQDDWEMFEFDGLDLNGKTVAVFGVGDSASYSDMFCNGMAKLYKFLKNAGANLVGEVDSKCYEFDASEAVNENGNFVGLALDFDNESDKNEERIESWVKEIKSYFE
ncbi:MAG: flavodoxin FldA [Campylobacter sp.]|nr:flavodoxin FldA [Campylobacter sp.]